MLSNILKQALEKEFTALGNQNPEIKAINTVHGGSVNQAFKIETAQQNYFVKINSKSKFPNLFETEAKGLELLSNTKTIKIPKVYAHNTQDDDAFLIMEFIEEGIKSPDFWEDFGRQLAAFHQNSAATFGLDYVNYIGSLKQINSAKEKWSDFFIENRLQVQLKMAVDSNLIENTMLKKFQQLFINIPTYFPEEKPALLHGDLWSGNFMVGANGQALIMDPAVYYGHREMDLAMSHLFGGFQQNFYSAYNEIFPLEKNWIERIELCNIYPLLVHVNLFGKSYVNRLQAVLNRLI